MWNKFRLQTRGLAVWIIAMGGLVHFVQAAQQPRAIDAPKSKLTVYGSKGGLMSTFGDNHQVEAPISEGFIDEDTRRVQFVVESQRMKVLDPQLSPEKRQQVQERMLGPDVLNIARYPYIRFESNTVEPSGPSYFVVHGQLSLHGVTRPVIVNVRKENGHYLGTTTLKQQDFGITPISIGGGTVRVKDELKIDFDIRPGDPTPQHVKVGVPE